MIGMNLAGMAAPQMLQAAPQQTGIAAPPTAPRFGHQQSPSTYGLAGAEAAMVQGTQNALGQYRANASTLGRDMGNAQRYLDRGRRETRDVLGRGIREAGETLSPYAQAGTDASQLQAAMAGALGPEAQAQAAADFQNSPYMEQALANAERGIMRNASALGGIGSGNTMDQLYQNAAGMFMNDWNNRFSQLGSLSDRGYSAAGTQAGIGAQLRGQMAGHLGDMNRASANTLVQGAGLRQNLSNQIAQTQLNLGNNIGGLRYQAGGDIANALSSTTSALANATNQQGAGLSDLTGSATTSVTSLIDAAAQGDAGSKEYLATLLSNLATGQGSQLASIPQATITQPNMLGQVGQLASGIGGMMPYMFGGQNRTPAPIVDASGYTS